MNKKDISLFYDFLGHKKQTEIRAIDKKSKYSKSYFCQTKEEFIRKCEELNGKCDLYAGINERCENGTTDKEVEYITIIGHDVDCHSDIEKITVASEQVKKLKEDCLKFDFKEPLTLCSGFGLWVLHKIKPIKNTPENVERIKEFAKTIKNLYEVEGIDFDTTVYNPSRIARIPGTFNLREGSKTLSFCLNDPKIVEDEELTENICSINLIKDNTEFIQIESPGECAFMDYCLENYIVPGDRHKILSSHMAKYLMNKKDKEILKRKYIQTQKGTLNDINGWENWFKKNTQESSFNCGALINFQKLKGIPLKCIGCSKYNQNKIEPRGWALSVSIKEMAKNHSLEKCPKCNTQFEFNDKLGWWKCNKCNKQGGIKKFAQLVLELQE